MSCETSECVYNYSEPVHVVGKFVLLKYSYINTKINSKDYTVKNCIIIIVIL